MHAKVKYKAFYRPPGFNPFRGRTVDLLTKTVEVDATVTVPQVEKWAREAQENNQFVRVEKL